MVPSIAIVNSQLCSYDLAVHPSIASSPKSQVKAVGMLVNY